MFIRKSIYTLSVLIAVSISARSQSKSLIIDTANLMKQANTMAEAFIRSDFKTLVKYTYPRVVQMAGGEQRMIEAISQSISEMREEGFSFNSVQVEITDQKVNAGKEIHTLVKQKISMRFPGGTAINNSYLLAVSMDSGNRWYFVDVSPLYDEAKLKIFFPHFNPTLKIPEKQKPIVIKSE